MELSDLLQGFSTRLVQSRCNNIVTALCCQLVTILLQQVYIRQPSNTFDIAVKLVTSCQQVVTNLEQEVQTQLADGLLTDVLQAVRFLCA